MNHKTDLLPYCQKALIDISKMDSIQSTVTYHSGVMKSLHLSVFGSATESCAFFFYESYSPEKIELKLGAALSAIGTGDFLKIQKAAKEQDL